MRANCLSNFGKDILFHPSMLFFHYSTYTVIHRKCVNCCKQVLKYLSYTAFPTHWQYHPWHIKRKYIFTLFHVNFVQFREYLCSYASQSTRLYSNVSLFALQLVGAFAFENSHSIVAFEIVSSNQQQQQQRKCKLIRTKLSSLQSVWHSMYHTLGWHLPLNITKLCCGYYILRNILLRLLHSAHLQLVLYIRVDRPLENFFNLSSSRKQEKHRFLRLDFLISPSFTHSFHFTKTHTLFCETIRSSLSNTLTFDLTFKMKKTSSKAITTAWHLVVLRLWFFPNKNSTSRLFACAETYKFAAMLIEIKWQRIYRL